MNLRANKFLVFFFGFGATVLAYQNCAKVEFGAVQGSFVAGLGDKPMPVPAAQKDPNATPPPGSGLCVLKCQEKEDDDNNNNLDQSGKISTASANDHDDEDCDDNDNDGDINQAHTISARRIKIVKFQAADEEEPQAVCMSKPACEAIAAALSSQSVGLRLAKSQKISRVKSASLAADDDDECENDVDDDAVKRFLIVGPRR